MTERDFEITEAQLLAYADGRVSDTERAAIERYLAANPAKAAEVANWQRQNEALTALFPVPANEAIPERLSSHKLARARAANDNFRFSQIAAAIVLVLIGGAIGWFGRDTVTPVTAASDVLIDSAV